MKNLALVFFIFISVSLFAQSGKHDVVYLKNGSIVKGSILVLDPEKFVKLKTRDHNIWVFEMKQIDSISRPVKAKTPLKTGYFNLSELGILAGNTSNAKRAPLTLMNVNMWRFENGISAGLGVGVHFFNETYLPVVADFRYHLRRSGPVPFASVQAGYSIPLGGTYNQQYYYAYDSRSSIYPGPTPGNQNVSARGGLLVNPAIGIQTQINENFALTFSAGYSYLRHRYGKEEAYALDVDYNRLSLKIGLLFK
jgi:hypothetical protein